MLPPLRRCWLHPQQKLCVLAAAAVYTDVVASPGAELRGLRLLLMLMLLLSLKVIDLAGELEAAVLFAGVAEARVGFAGDPVVRQRRRFKRLRVQRAVNAAAEWPWLH